MQQRQERAAAAAATVHRLSVRAGEAKAVQVRALVPDYQLSLAIGKEGQNVRLAAKLTGAKIDVQPESILEGED